MGNQNLNALPKITLNGFNILLALTCFIFLNYLRNNSSKISEQTKIKLPQIAKFNKGTENV